MGDIIQWQHVTRKIIQLVIKNVFRSSHIQVLAEGLETAEQIVFLQQHGCHTYQGFLKRRLMPAETFAIMLRTNQDNQQKLLYATPGKTVIHFELS